MKRLLTQTDKTQFAIIPTFGVISGGKYYKFRVAFMFGFWRACIGCFRLAELEAAAAGGKMNG